jgi:hypothetical protein
LHQKEITTLRKTTIMSRGKKDCIKKNSTMTRRRRRRNIKKIGSFVEQQQHHGEKEHEFRPTITTMSRR